MIQVRDVAFVRLAAPDLDAIERFLHDFGLVTTPRAGEAPYTPSTTPPSSWRTSTRSCSDTTP